MEQTLNNLDSLKTKRPFSKERCIVCHAETNYLVGTPVFKRSNYVIGVGQMCSYCFKENYIKNCFVENEELIHLCQDDSFIEQKNAIEQFDQIIEIDKKYSDEFYDNFLLSFLPNKRKRYFYRFTKRLVDILLSSVALLLLLIPFCVIALLVKLDSKGPVFFKNRRIGRNGEVFNCLKFRSMQTTAPKEMATSLGGTDSYITKVGKFLRKTSLDELPQLINVFRGDMSIIGYRPLVPSEQNCNDMRKQLCVFDMRPGISGLAQVMGRDDVYYKNKAIIDAFYVKKASLLFDFKIVIKTFNVVIF